MPSLEQIYINELVALLEPFVRTEDERRTLLETIFAGTASKPDIDVKGETVEFTRRLIFRLRDYSEIEPGAPALWTLLQAIRPRVGADQQAQIDALRSAIFAAAAPVADYVIVNAGGKHIFISYAHANRPFVDRLRADL